MSRLRAYRITNKGSRHSQWEAVVDGKTTGRAFIGDLATLNGKYLLVTYVAGDTILLTDEEAKGKYLHLKPVVALDMGVQVDAQGASAPAQKPSGNVGEGNVGEVDIPDDWSDMRAKDRKDLASKIAGREISTAAEADEVIEAELARRNKE